MIQIQRPNPVKTRYSTEVSFKAAAHIETPNRSSPYSQMRKQAPSITSPSPAHGSPANGPLRSPQRRASSSAALTKALTSPTQAGS
jgi:hypothetical protein